MCVSPGPCIPGSRRCARWSIVMNGFDLFGVGSCVRQISAYGCNVVRKFVVVCGRTSVKLVAATAGVIGVTSMLASHVAAQVTTWTPPTGLAFTDVTGTLLNGTNVTWIAGGAGITFALSMIAYFKRGSTTKSGGIIKK